jgi:hypothetical protein
VVEAQSENKTKESRLGTELLTKFVQGAIKSGNVEDFARYYTSHILERFKYVSIWLIIVQ